MCFGSRSCVSAGCDWQCYLDQYEDLQNAFGANNVAAAESHYQNHGNSEGRDCTCPGLCCYTFSVLWLVKRGMPEALLNLLMVLLIDFSVITYSFGRTNRRTLSRTHCDSRPNK